MSTLRVRYTCLSVSIVEGSNHCVSGDSYELNKLTLLENAELLNVERGSAYNDHLNFKGLSAKSQHDIEAS